MPENRETSRRSDPLAYGALPGDQRPASYMARDGYVRGDEADLWLRAHTVNAAQSPFTTIVHGNALVPSQF